MTPTHFMLPALPLAASIAQSVRAWLTRPVFPSVAIMVLTLLLLGGVAFAGWWFYRRKQQRQIAGRTTPEGLFAELCEVHRLAASERELLWSVARTSKLTHPALVFLDAGTLISAAEQRPELAARLQRLVDRLFSVKAIPEA